MNKLTELVQSLWIKTQLKAPPFLQRTAILRLHEAKEIARLLVNPHLPRYEMQGQGKGGPLTVTYIGLEYTKPFFQDILFVEKPVEQLIGRIPFWRYNRILDSTSSDIVIVEAAKHLINRLPRRDAIVLPAFVHHIMDARGDWQDIRKRMRKSIHKNELRLVRKYGYEYKMSHDRQDFEKFYQQMYLPTMKMRHKELSSPASANEAYQTFKHGALLQVNRDGEWVSGVIWYLEQNILVAKISGVKNADEQLIKEGAVAATYHALIQWANQHGHKAVNFMGTNPYLKDGLFQHKRKWGMAISVPPHLHRQMWIRVRRMTPAVAEFFKENPFVITDRNKKLHALIIVDDPHNTPPATRQEWEKRYITPGLDSLLVRSTNSFSEKSAQTPKPDLVIPIPPNPKPKK